MSIIDPIAVARCGTLTGVGPTAQFRTPNGMRRAENIRPGDLVVTRDSGLQPVRMVFTTTLRRAVALDPENAAVRLARRAVGPMMPQAEIVLAPDQRILLPAHLVAAELKGPGGLIPARALAGTSDAAWLDRTADDVPLYNLLFDRHEIVSASGLLVDSYRPASRELALLDDDDLRERLSRCYPQLREKRDPFPPCAYETVPPEAYLPARC